MARQREQNFPECYWHESAMSEWNELSPLYCLGITRMLQTASYWQNYPTLNPKFGWDWQVSCRSQVQAGQDAGETIRACFSGLDLLIFGWESRTLVLVSALGLERWVDQATNIPRFFIWRVDWESAAYWKLRGFWDMPPFMSALWMCSRVHNEKVC